MSVDSLTQSATTHPSKAASVDINSLYLVKSEIDQSLTDTETALSNFMDNRDTASHLPDCAAEMHQVGGVLHLLQLHGASELATAIGDVLLKVAAQNEIKQHESLGALSEGLLLMSRYLQFVILRERTLPHFLLEATNRLRQCAGQSPLGEGYILHKTLTPEQLQSNGQPSALSQQDNQARLHLLHRAFKVALHALLTQKATVRHYDVLAKVTAEMAKLSAQGGNALYWQAASQATHDLNPQSMLPLTRLRALIHVEQQFKHADTAPSTIELSNILAFAASRSHAGADRLREEHDKQNVLVHDEHRQQLSRYLFGPGSEDIHAVSQLVIDDISVIYDLLDTLNASSTPDDFSKLAAHIHASAQTLRMLNLTQAADQLLAQETAVKTWTQMPTESELYNLMQTLLEAENDMILLNKSYSAGGILLPIHNKKIALQQLDEAYRVLIQESRLALEEAKTDLLTYQEAGDAATMQKLPNLLEALSGSLLFLNSNRGQHLARGTAHYLEQHYPLASPDTAEPQPVAEPKAEPDVLNRLADILSCFDLFLENLQNKKPIGELPFKQGEKSLDLLKSA